MNVRFLWHAWKFFEGYTFSKRVISYVAALRYVWAHRHDHDNCPVCAAERKN